VLHEVNIAKIDVFYCFKRLLFFVLSNTLQKGFTQALKNNRIVAWQIFKEALADLQYFFRKIVAFHPSLRLTAKVEDVSQDIYGGLLESGLHEMRMLNIKIL